MIHIFRRNDARWIGKATNMAMAERIIDWCVRINGNVDKHDDAIAIDVGRTRLRRTDMRGNRPFGTPSMADAIAARK